MLEGIKPRIAREERIVEDRSLTRPLVGMVERQETLPTRGTERLSSFERTPAVAVRAEAPPTLAAIKSENQANLLRAHAELTAARERMAAQRLAEVEARFAHQTKFKMEAAQAANPTTTPAQMMTLIATHPGEVAHNPAATAEVLTRLHEICRGELVWGHNIDGIIGSNPNLPEALQIEIANSRNSLAVASNPKLSAKAFAILARDSSRWMEEALAANPVAVAYALTVAQRVKPSALRATLQHPVR